MNTKYHLIKEADKSLTESQNHYLINDSLMSVLQERSDLKKSIKAMIDCEILRLPFKECIIEFNSCEGSTRVVWLCEQNEFISAKTAFINKDLISVYDGEFIIRSSSEGIYCQNITFVNKNDESACLIACNIALLLLNLKGVEKKVINSDKLNKHRVKSGRVQIKDYTVLSIGTVYNSSGDSVVCKEHKKMTAIFMRAGHTRLQRVGHGRLDSKLIYIEPCFVNFNGESEYKNKLKKVNL
jgi:hypothetical protein